MPSVLIIGAHPDDAEVKAGGLTALWRDHGIDVTYGIMTDGSAGHHEMEAASLAARRKKEAEEATRRLGAQVMMLGFPDGMLVPSLEARVEVIRLIRKVQPDLVLTHRTVDYHPDHRATAQLVQDAAYMVTVPRVAPETPILKKNPIFGYLSDRFTRPTPFSWDVAVSIDSVVDRVVEGLDAHGSQFYEWLPFNMGIIDEVPRDPVQRKERLKEWFFGTYALRAKDAPAGSELKGEYFEAVEITQYGSPLSANDRKRLFPFA